MANDVLTPDIYEISELVDSIKAKYIDLPEDTLMMGMYGYLSELFTNTIENNIMMSAEYANEAIPTKAKFERSVLSHALSLGINSIRANPAFMNVLICIPRDLLDMNLVNDRFTIDKYINFKIGTSDTYNYRLDYDIIIHRNLLPSGKYVYTAIYDMETEEINEVSDINNPYLPALGVTKLSNTDLIMIPTVIRQIQLTEIYKTIIVDNPLENKTITFDFEDQLAYFNVVAQEGDKTYYLNPVYDGLTDISNEYFCNYTYVTQSRIRIKFNRDSYQPRSNTKLVINIYTTKGSECNFEYNSDTVINMESNRFSYDNGIWMLVRPISESMEGKDRDTVESIRRKIPKQMLMRGSVTTTTDLNNYFNFLNSDKKRLYFLEKVHNQIERLYYSYLVMKNDIANIIPTNTCDVTFDKRLFSNINKVNSVISPGALYYYDPASEKCEAIINPSDSEVEELASNGFLYTNIFLTLVNKNPFFTGYYLNILNYSRQLNFEFINDECEVQFISANAAFRRLYYTDRDTYTLEVQFEQNINEDFALINVDEEENITECLISIYAVIYVDGQAIRYIKGDIDQEASDIYNYSYNYKFRFKTNDIIDKNNNISITNGLMISNDMEQIAYLPRNIEVKLYVLAKLDKEYGRDEVIDAIVGNGLDGYSLTNIYGINGGLDLYYDYTDIMTSYTTISLDKTTNNYIYDVRKMPLIKYNYLDTEDKILEFIKVLETNRIYISSVLLLLEDSFGVDFKFFNTYGPSKLYNIDKDSLINNTALSLKFELKFVMSSDSYILTELTAFIKDYLEDINNLSDLHMPNLITEVTNKFREQLVYFKFLDVNGYGPTRQSIYKEDMDTFVESTIVPEFLNVNTTDDGEADIQYVIVE